MGAVGSTLAGRAKWVYNQDMNRRQFLKSVGIACVGLAVLPRSKKSPEGTEVPVGRGSACMVDNLGIQCSIDSSPSYRLDGGPQRVGPVEMRLGDGPWFDVPWIELS